jgi:hypothetical protein
MTLWRFSDAIIGDSLTKTTNSFVSATVLLIVTCFISAGACFMIFDRGLGWTPEVEHQQYAVERHDRCTIRNSNLKAPTKFLYEEFGGLFSGDTIHCSVQGRDGKWYPEDYAQANPVDFGGKATTENTK